MKRSKYQLAGLSISLILIFFIFQLIFLYAHFSSNSSNNDFFIINIIKLCISKYTLFPFLILIAAQLISSAVFFIVLWYEAVTISEWFQFSHSQARLLVLALWLASMLTIVLTNYYISTHSVFSQIIDNAIGMGLLSGGVVYSLFVFFSFICLLAIIATFIIMIISLYRKSHFLRHVAALLVLVCCIAVNVSFPRSHHRITVTQQNQPNIIIIGFDALRPDFLTFFNADRKATPHFDAFLKSSIVFNDSYTPLARTAPTWASILTGLYPLHHHERDNLTAFESLDLSHTLPKALKKQGYETIYASDDNVFNNMGNKSVGFDRIIGQSGDMFDLVISTLNDFPISNLIAMTNIGYYLYPFNYANHSSPQTYRPSVFLDQVDGALQKRGNKPLFLAVHLNVTAYPFYLANDQQHDNISIYKRYQYAVTQGDVVFSEFLKILESNGLLNQAIVVLLSDHGIALKQPGDRITFKNLYQGNIKDIKKLTMSNYEDNVPLSKEVFGTDTSSGYGGDVLSLTQNHQIFAMRFYGKLAFAPRIVKGYVTPIDIKPTLLDLLHLEDVGRQDGISLLPCLTSKVSGGRSLYLESAFTPTELNNANIDRIKLLNESYRFVALDPLTNKIYLTPASISLLSNDKQRAIIRGDWLLAFYPISHRADIVKINNSYEFKSKQMPAYFVLVNLTSGKWTTDIHQAFAKQAPMKSLLEKLNDFYGDEMKNYKGALQ